MPNLGGWEWVILAVVALLLFGGTRLAGFGKNAGKAIREFKEETKSIKADEAPRPDASRPAPRASDEVLDAEIVERPADPKTDKQL